MNNFDKLFEDDKYNYPEDAKRAGRNGVWQSLGTFRFLGQIVDVYLPAVVGVFISAIGGRQQGTDAKRRGSNSVRPPGAPKDIRPDGSNNQPGKPGDIIR